MAHLRARRFAKQALKVIHQRTDRLIVGDRPANGNAQSGGKCSRDGVQHDSAPGIDAVQIVIAHKGHPFAAVDMVHHQLRRAVGHDKLPQIGHGNPRRRKIPRRSRLCSPKSPAV